MRQCLEADEWPGYRKRNYHDAHAALDACDAIGKGSTR